MISIHKVIKALTNAGWFIYFYYGIINEYILEKNIKRIIYNRENLVPLK